MYVKRLCGYVAWGGGNDRFQENLDGCCPFVRKTAPPQISNWVEWVHIPMGLTHCDTCLRLNGCWFPCENKPKLPQHPRCHCTVEPIPFSSVLSEATAICRLSKINPCLFDPEGIYKHKKEKMFESWGYRIEDSEWLQQEFEKQALEKYIAGQYALGKLNKDGQRLSVRVELPRKDREGTASFIAGWMVHPNGQIQLTTPYGGA